MIRAILLALVVATPALAAGAPDPDWPCVQRRQPSLSLAQVWPGPLPDAAVEAMVGADDVQAVARVIALRRTPMDAADAEIADFAQGREPAALTALMVATLDHVNQARNRVLSGITRYAHKQKDLDLRILELRHAFDAANAAEPQDFDRIDALEADLDWSMRIFKDRQQSLTYVCETPVILEQRAFALGRSIAGHLPQ
jgi:hypothetical protein